MKIMRRQYATLCILVLAVVTLAGCVGSSGDDYDINPAKKIKETGNTIHLKMTVVDLVKAKIYPQLEANMWAFCVEAADPNDAYSVAAITYQNPTGVVEKLNSAGEFAIDTANNGKCSVPGPQINAKQGDKIIVDFVNNHFHPHTIHWHGQYVPFEMDGVPGSNQDPVVPTTSFRYEFIAKRAGTLWYHCHVDVQFHVMMGLYGAFIVEPQDMSLEPEADKEYTWVLSTAARAQIQRNPDVVDPHAKHKHGQACGPSGFPNCQNPRVDVTPDTWMINGRSAPLTMMDNKTLIVADEGDTVRLRLINAGESVETIHLHGHDMLVTHKDGVPLHPNARFYADTILIGPAERYDVIIEFDNPGVWHMHDHTDSHVTNDGMSPGGAMSMLVYTGFEDKMQQFTQELFGGLPYLPAYDLPEDYFGYEYFSLPEAPLTAQTLASLAFPVELPCAVKTVKAMIDVSSDGINPLTLLSAYQAKLIGPSGTVLATSSLDSAGRAFFTVLDEKAQQPPRTRVADLVVGDYKIELSGTSTAADASFSVRVDYYETMLEAYSTATGLSRTTCPNSPMSPFYTL